MAQARRGLSPEHKKAMSEGRAQSKAINRYLEFLEESKPRRGRRRDLSRIHEQIASIDAVLPEAHGLRKVDLMQQRADLAGELERNRGLDDRDQLEADFVKYAAAYSERKGISYKTWLAFGVPTTILDKCNIGRW